MDLKELHKKCFHNVSELHTVGRCGCFYCQMIFDILHIEEWTDNGLTAICPFCGVDSVIPLYPQMDESILEKMYDYYFALDKDNNQSDYDI